ncbi:MAG: dihydroorotase, partial [Pyrinomonadaceae bacterium]|nr:dihydroorotase [Sphingobacteriaceae bacterium]
MKPILIRSVTILHPASALHTKISDILIVEGKISKLAQNIDSPVDAVVIDGKGKYISPGFFDLNVNFGEPGFETKEDLISGTASAIAGGFTGVAVQPSTNPPIHSKSEVSYIVNRTKEFIVDVHPLGCISHNREGKDLAELYDMRMAGAVAFTDGTKPIQDSGLMSRAILYAKGFGGLVFSFPEDLSIAGKGKMNEGEMSTFLGIKGLPALA